VSDTPGRGEKRTGDTDARRAGDERFGPGPVSAPADAVAAINQRGAPEDDVDSPPPVGISWGRLYTGVILTLLLVIVALTLFERAYRP